MASTPQAVTGLAADLIATLAKDSDKNGRLGYVARYLRGEHDLPYAPRGAKLEYRTLARKSVTNWLPLISDTFAKALWVDGYRAPKASDNAKAWSYWQANGLDARQSVAHRGALEHGVSHTLILPGDVAPLIRPQSPLRCQAFYEDDDDEWPQYGLIAKGRTIDGDMIFEVLDDKYVWTIRVPKAAKGQASKPVVVGNPDEHGLGVTPLVRFRDRLDGEAVGVIRPLINLQDRINEAVFALMIAIQFASFRQRWATGLAIPLDENQFIDAQGNGTQASTDGDGKANRANPNFGKPLEPFQAAVDRLWVSDNPDARFGDFAQTEVSGHIANYEGAVKTLAGIGQISPHVLLGDLVNLSADALAAAEASTQRKAGEYETLFGESWEQGFRLAALADGDKKAAKDTSAQVRWRDTEARALASTVDALGKMAQMLQVPVEGLWERIPGVTDTDVTNWKAMAQSSDGLAAIAAALNRQAAPAGPTAPNSGAAQAPATPPGGAPAA